MKEDNFRAALDAYWSPKYREWGIYHVRYNPAPTIDVVPAQPMPAPDGLLLGYSNQAQIIGRANVGIEILLTKNGEIAVFLTGGTGAGLGASLVHKVYGGPVFDLAVASDYAGPALSAEAGYAAPIGPVLGTYRGVTPDGVDGPYGVYVGMAGGLGGGGSVSASGAVPIFIYDSRSRDLYILPGFGYSSAR